MLRGGAAFIRSAMRRPADLGAGREKKGQASFPRTLQPHRLNQPQKEAYLIPYLSRALEALPPHPVCLELFCADGYYSCLMARMRPQAVVTGVDRGWPDLTRARAAAKILELPQVTFQGDDVFHFLQSTETAFDLVLCAGGLYHLANPFQLLDELRRVARGFLVIQSAITLETEAEDYFITPAPGWKHGSRFTHAGLKRGLERLGWRIIDQARNELPGNRRQCDRGSSYFLCQAPPFPETGQGTESGVVV
ncbi:MAG: methyltransferase domain-containing protein [Deltaproteobacteria bacterium]|nr:methyltransferase domain-containing protein [Deltaproteobacteria bacterium]